MLPSLVRTVVPLIVGFLISLSFMRGVDQDSLTELVTLLVTAAYYIIVRLLEHYVSGSFGFLLGWPSPPQYQKTIQGEVVAPVVTGGAK